MPCVTPNIQNYKKFLKAAENDGLKLARNSENTEQLREIERNKG